MKTKQLLIMAIVTLVVLTSCGGGSKKADLSYAPWPDLSAHFDLEKVTHVKGNNMLTFNSYEISQGKAPITSDRLENSEYSAMILGFIIICYYILITENPLKYFMTYINIIAESL